jgi:hypothetical protein
MGLAERAELDDIVYQNILRYRNTYYLSQNKLIDGFPFLPELGLRYSS